ncbi:MAG: magnesium/cobalt transporter CorA [Bacteroidetes bacterium]|nr:magnesium/cobalt transporter CorA [Bacteroidota bacterium]
MTRFVKKAAKSHGMAPGSVVFIGKQKMTKSRIRIIDYNNKNLKEKEIQDAGDLAQYIESDTVTWINIDGLHDIELIAKIGELFNMHSLLLEDVVNTAQRPKVEEFDSCVFLVMKMLRYDKDNKEVKAEQLSMVLMKNVLITFQEQVGDVFESVRNRIRDHIGRIRKTGPDYLAYSLFDTVVDNYIRIVENLGEQIENIEQEIIDNPSQKVLQKIYTYKQEIGFLGKYIRPVREMVTRLQRTETDLIRNGTEQFIKDLYDLATHTLDTVETYRDVLSDYLNIYHTGVSNRMNEVMKVLTIFAAIFIPLTFIAGIYGTNFDYFPEIHLTYGYLFFWIVLIVVAIGMLFYFRKKKWF